VSYRVVSVAHHVNALFDSFATAQDFANLIPSQMKFLFDVSNTQIIAILIKQLQNLFKIPCAFSAVMHFHGAVFIALTANAQVYLTLIPRSKINLDKKGG
jgi:hypothetical protein